MTQEEMLMRDLKKRFRFGRRQPAQVDRSSFAVSRPGLQVKETEEVDFGQVARQAAPQMEESNPWGQALGGIASGLANKGASFLDGKKDAVTEEEFDMTAAEQGGRRGLLDAHFAEEGRGTPVLDASIIEEETDVPSFQRTPRGSDTLYDEITRRQNKDLKKGGKDADKTHNFKDVLRSFGLGALKGLSNADPRGGWEGMLGSALGSGAAGGVSGAIDPNTDERLGNEMALAKLIPQYEQQYGMEQKREQDDLKRRKAEAEITLAEGKPDITKRNLDIKEFTAINNAEHKRNMATLGKERADEVKANNERIFELRKRGLDQNDKRIQILEERNAEIKRNNDLNREQRDRKFAITTAQKDRDFYQKQENFRTKLEAKIAADKVKGTLDAIKLRKSLQEDLAEGNIDQETFDALIARLQ